MQAVGRWGNYFNQELYGPPTTLPWGIPIECAHRVLAYPCAVYPEATTRFEPLFLYESISGILGALFLVWLGFTFRSRLRPGDLLLVFFIWYGTTRFILETQRTGNWTFFGAPVAQIISLVAVIGSIALLAYRHRRGHPSDRPATYPQVQTWGAIGAEWMTRPIDEPWANVPEAEKPDWDAIIDADEDAGAEGDADAPDRAAEPTVDAAPDEHAPPDDRPAPAG
jgi:hypothetical protein